MSAWISSRIVLSFSLALSAAYFKMSVSGYILYIWMPLYTSQNSITAAAF